VKVYEEYVPYGVPTPKVIQADYVGDFAIRVKFDDDTNQLVDFKGFLFKSSHPDIIPFQSEDHFKGFEVKSGNINWYDYELIFSVNDLYKGAIS